LEWHQSELLFSQRSTTTHRARQLKVWYAMLGCWLALLVFINWQPFNFDFSFSTASRRLANLSWLPFADYLQGDYLSAMDQICSKIVMFMPLGGLLAISLFGQGRRYSTIAAVISAFTVAMLLETGQLLLPTRYASVTDVIIETFGGWVGYSA